MRSREEGPRAKCPTRHMPEGGEEKERNREQWRCRGAVGGVGRELRTPGGGLAPKRRGSCEAILRMVVITHHYPTGCHPLEDKKRETGSEKTTATSGGKAKKSVR